MRQITPLLAALLPAAIAAAAPVETAPAPSEVVLVLPFATPAGAKDAWLGGAVQQDLIADLTQGTHTIIEAPSNAAPAADAGQALKTARSLGAGIVVYGQVQTTSTEVRLTGQVVDVGSARVIGALKATGPTSDLFHLEDALSGQALVALPRAMLNASVLQAMQNPQAQAPVQQPVQQQLAPQQPEQPAEQSPTATIPYAPPPQPDAYSIYTYVSPPDYDPTYAYPDYSYDYGYGCPVPAYSYACPSIGLFPFGGFYGYVGGGFVGHHDHDGDGFHHRWESGGHGYHNGGASNGHGGAGAPHGGFVAGGHSPAMTGGRSFAAPRVHTYAPRQGFSYSSRPSIGYRSLPTAGGLRSFQSGGLSHAGSFRSGGFSGGFHGGGFGGGFHGGGGGFHAGAGGSHGASGR